MTDEDLMTSNVADDNITISSANYNYTYSTFPNMNNYTITTAPNTLGSQFVNTGNLTFTTTDATQHSLDVKGDANFEGDLKIKGKSIVETLEKIESRLAILQPDPKKLEKYEALRKAYEHYKTLERLIGQD